MKIYADLIRINKYKNCKIKSLQDNKVKKIPELVKSESEKLYQEIIDTGYGEKIAKEISDEMKEKGGYMFNKAHSSCYGILTLQTAYLKANYPVEFFCALLNQKRDDYGMINKYILDAKTFGVEILPPHLNDSDRTFSIKDGKILFGLEAIKGIGSKFVDIIIEERNKKAYSNFNDFYKRTSPSVAMVVSLAKSGAIPCKNKYQFLLSFAKSLYIVKEYTDVKTLPKLSILKEKYGIDGDVIKDKEERLKLYNEQRRIEFNITQKEKQKKELNSFIEKYMSNEKSWEFEALSVFITNNPFIEAYKYIHDEFEDVADGGKGVVVGIVSNTQKKKDRHGKQFAFVWLYSAYGLVEVTCWHTQYKHYEELIKRGNELAVLYKKSDDKAIVEDIKTYHQWLKDRKLTNKLSA